MSVSGSIESRDYALLQQVRLTRPIDKVEEIPWDVCLEWSTDGEVYYGLIRDSGILQKSNSNVED